MLDVCSKIGNLENREYLIEVYLWMHFMAYA